MVNLNLVLFCINVNHADKKYVQIVISRTNAHMEKDSMDSKEKKTLNERLEISDYNGDSGLLGHELSFDGLFNAQEIDEVRKILGINQDEIGIVEIIRKMSKSLAENRTSDYQKLGIDLHDHMTEYFLKGDG